jgi:sensor histidine kinase YesM
MLKSSIFILISSFLGGVVLTWFFPGGFIGFLVTMVLLILYHFLVLGSRSYILKTFPREGHNFKHILILTPIFFSLSFLSVLGYSFLLRKVIQSALHINYQPLLFISLFLTIFLVTIFEGFDFFIHWKKYIIRSERIEKANLLAQYETLRNQLNPHFLFNGLNTLISFIEQQDKRAATFAQNLSDFLKYLLTYNKQKLITLQQELVIVNQYAFLQGSRFEDNLKVTINVPDEFLDWMVPPLTLQMLVENAIKHNKISSTYKLGIDIYENDHYIYIKNNLQLKNKVESAHVGLENIKGRYKLFTNQEVKIETTITEYKIGIPLLRKNGYS